MEFVGKNILFLFYVLIIFIIIYYLFFPNNEHFTSTSDITDMYKNDVTALRNITTMASNIISSKDTLDLKGSVQFNSLSCSDNSPNINLFIRYMIISWNSSSIPTGWVLCDGSKYSSDLVNKHLIDNNYKLQSDPNGDIVTPDLRGRFIIGAGDINITTDNQPMFSAFPDPNDPNKYILSTVDTTVTIPLNKNGGEIEHTITKDEIPPHTHNYLVATANGVVFPPTSTHDFYNVSIDHVYADGTRIGTEYYTRTSNSNTKTTVMNTDGGQIGINNNNPQTPINNMPPYYVLYYIMKL